MKFKAYAHRAPRLLAAPLFGDRERFGLIPDETDPCWQEWAGTYHLFYESTQKSGVGLRVNNAGYSILDQIDLSCKRVLEIGPGGLYHLPFWSGRPSHYALVDLDESFLQIASAKLAELSIEHDLRLTDRNSTGRIPATDGEFDLIVSFFSMEHLYPFADHLREMMRVLKPGGSIVGAIPAEGGLAWGLGRFLTSRRWLRKNTNIDPDKIICWEHPTMADEILTTLSENLQLRKLSYWPLRVPLIDVNLVLRFVFSKRG